MMQEITNKLYIVATPIGNLNELSARGLFVLEHVDLIACEDTRNTKKLCTYFNINTPLISCHQHNEKDVADSISDAILDGKSVALVSDAGYPSISDPGNFLIKKCIQKFIDFEVISGPCALINALVGSGLDASHFYFHGFLDHSQGKRKKELELLKDKTETLIFYEAPHRIKDMIDDLYLILGNRYICIAKELTKKFENYIRGSLEEIKTYLENNELKGELVVVVEGLKKEKNNSIDTDKIINLINDELEKSVSLKEALKVISKQSGISKNELYKIYLLKTK